MKSKTTIGIIAILAILLGVIVIALSDKNGGWYHRPTITPTITSTPTTTPSLTPTNTHTPTGTPTFTPTSTPTFTPTATHTPTRTSTATPILMCTPPVCAIGTSEVYICPGGNCPGGCGTTCATFTPRP